MPDNNEKADKRLEIVSQLVPALEAYIAERQAREADPEFTQARVEKAQTRLEKLRGLSQTDYAGVLAENLSLCGHEINSWDLLDALASTGLRLTCDAEGVAFESYSELVRESAKRSIRE